MIRLHNGSTTSLNVFSDGELIIANIFPKQTSLYINVCGRVLKGVSLTNQQIFTAKIKIKSDRKYTILLTPSTVRVYKDDYKNPRNGTALVRDINSSNIFYEQPLGNLTINGVTFNAINRGVYTVFTGISVLYNDPEDLEQDICFQEYIGKWNVYKQIGVPGISSYIFSQTTDGEWELPINDSMSMINSSATSTTVDSSTTSTAVNPQVNNTIVNMTVPFSWIVHKTDYKEYSLNGTSDRQKLLILTRCGMSKCKYDELLCLAKKLGYNISKI